MNAASLRALVSDSSNSTVSTSTRRCSTRPRTCPARHLGAPRRAGRAVAAAWVGVSEAAQSLARAELDAGERASRLELVEFQLAELRKAAITEGEDEALERARDVLRHAGRLQTLCAEAYGLLYDDETAALGTLAQVWKRVGELAAIDDTFAPHAAARDAIKAQLDDLALTLRDYGERLEASPGRLQEVEDRLALLERLKRKHGPTLDDVTRSNGGPGRELDALTGGPRHKDAARAALDAARTAFAAVAGTLSKARHTAAPALGAAVEAGLAELAMARTRFEVRLSTTDSPQGWHAGGIDTAEFFLAAEPRRGPASAGADRLGRRAVAHHAGLQDPGGGRAPRPHAHLRRGRCRHRRAGGLGRRREAAVAWRAQPGALHHPPAADRGAGGHPLPHRQAVKGPRTVTAVTRLDARGREQEIARMMAGESALSSDVLTAARTLLQAKAKVAPEAKAKGESRPPGESEGA